MDLHFANRKIEKLCNSDRDLRRVLGAGGAKRCKAHLASLHAAASLDAFRTLPGRCHELVGERAGQLALVLPDGKRLVFEPFAQPPPTTDSGGLDWGAVTAISILEITDYH